MIKLLKLRRSEVFPVALLIYALVFLILTAIGLTVFWNFIEAYEMSRPQNTLDTYMETLTPEYVADRCGDLIATIDHNIQSEQECRDIIIAALDGKFSCAKKNKESTEDHYVYALRCGPKVIGTVEMTAEGEESYGFTPWKITADAFDLSYLLTEGASITVPENYPVYANGRQLSNDYITDKNIQYSSLKEFYNDYTLPTIVTYTVGPFLQNVELTVKDPAGNEVTINEETDYNTLLGKCTETEISALDTIVNEYVKLYMNLMTNKGGNPRNNYNSMVGTVVVKNSMLDSRLKQAVNGQDWINDRQAKLKSVTVNAYVALENGLYMCDVTYVVEQIVTQGGGRGNITTNMKLMFTQTAQGLKAEAMKSY